MTAAKLVPEIQSMKTLLQRNIEQLVVLASQPIGPLRREFGASNEMHELMLNKLLKLQELAHIIRTQMEETGYGTGS